MKAAVLQGIGQIEVVDVPKPRSGPGEVVIRVAYCGICGSDVEAYHCGLYEPGVIVGHEYAGTIAEVGPGVAGWQVGDRVTVKSCIACGECAPCREGRLDGCENQIIVGVTEGGGMAEYAPVTAEALLRLPDSVNLRQGALVEPLTIALHGVRHSQLRVGDHALVIGAGPIGLLTLQCALLAGARKVAVTEVDLTRAELAGRLGAAAVLDPTRDNVGVAFSQLTGGRGPDVVFICTGAPGPYSDAISLVRPGGQILVLGICADTVQADFLTVARNQLRIAGSFMGRGQFPAAIDFIAQGRIDVDGLVSDEIALEEVVTRGFDRLSRPGSGAVKIIVRIGGES